MREPREYKAVASDSVNNFVYMLNTADTEGWELLLIRVSEQYEAILARTYKGPWPRA